MTKMNDLFPKVGCENIDCAWNRDMSCTKPAIKIMYPLMQCNNYEGYRRTNDAKVKVKLTPMDFEPVRALSEVFREMVDDERIDVDVRLEYVNKSRDMLFKK
jgi:hypothetical protein